MKTIFLSILFICSLMNSSESPEGVWIYKENNSRIEILNRNGELTGTIISTRHPEYESGKEILKNFHLTGGKWEGEIFDFQKKRWVAAILEIKSDLLFVEINYGYDVKKIHLYKEK